MSVTNFIKVITPGNYFPSNETRYWLLLTISWLLLVTLSPSMTYAVNDLLAMSTGTYGLLAMISYYVCDSLGPVLYRRCKGYGL